MLSPLRSTLRALVPAGACLLAVALPALHAQSAPAADKPAAEQAADVVPAGKTTAPPPAPKADPLAPAREHLAAGRAEEAIAVLQGMLDAGTGDEVAVRVLMSEAEVSLGRPAEALVTLEPVAKGKHSDVLLMQGRASKAMGDGYARSGRQDDAGFSYDEARGYLEKAADAAPAGDSRAAVDLGMIELYIVGDHEAAMKRADKLLSRSKADGEALLLRGCAGVYVYLAAQDAGDAAEAESVAARAITDLLAADKALPKTRPEPWGQLAWLYETTGQQMNAVNAALKVLDRNKAADFTMLYHLAMRYAGERQLAAAAKALTEMVKRDPEQLGRWVAAEPEVKIAVAQLASSVEALADPRSGRPADGRDALKTLLAIEPSQDPNLWNNYGLLCRDTQQFEDSFKAYSRALELAPDEAGLLNDGAVILHYYLHRDYEKAQEMYERAIELATEELKDKKLADDRKAEMEKAKKEATDNLAKLAKGDYTWGG
jgi:tetratricopeptide (TPR) repeat protein